MSKHPLVEQFSVPVPAQAAAAPAANPVIRAPFDATVTAVTYAPKGTITGVNANTRGLSLVNRKQDGAGATQVASLQFDAGINAAAHQERALTLTATVVNRDVAEGDILACASTAVGTGLADPGGMLTVSPSRR